MPFDTGTYLRQQMEEAEARLAPHGRLGRYLVDIRRRQPRWEPRWAPAEKGLFDLGEVVEFPRFGGRVSATELGEERVR